MENQTLKKTNLVEIAVFYGIILAVLRVTTDVILKTLDVSSMTYYIGYVVGFVLEIILVVIAIRKYKKKNNGFLNFANGLKIGIIMLIITGIAFFLSSAFFDQDFQNRKAIEMVEQYNPEELDNVLEKIEEAKENPKYFISFSLWLIYFIFIGFVISAISSAIMQKKEEDTF